MPARIIPCSFYFSAFQIFTALQLICRIKTVGILMGKVLIGNSKKMTKNSHKYLKNVLKYSIMNLNIY